MREKTHVVKIGDLEVGGPRFIVMAGPCSVESEEQLLETATGVKLAGAHMLRGGLFKMRTSPHDFQGLGPNAFSIVKKVKEELGLKVVSEITDPRQISDLDSVVDVFQVGSRNMYNYSLLKELGQTQKPVLLKRGFSALIKEWLLAAEYVLKEGNPNVILCERGIRTFESTTRNTLDLNSVVYIKKHSSLPILVDPSHAIGMRELVPPLALAAAAAGADGLLIEVHRHPEAALSDGFQALNIPEFEQLMQNISAVLKISNRHL